MTPGFKDSRGRGFKWTYKQITDIEQGLSNYEVSPFDTCPPALGLVYYSLFDILRFFLFSPWPRTIFLFLRWFLCTTFSVETTDLFLYKKIPYTRQNSFFRHKRFKKTSCCTRGGKVLWNESIPLHRQLFFDVIVWKPVICCLILVLLHLGHLNFFFSYSEMDIVWLNRFLHFSHWNS